MCGITACFTLNKNNINIFHDLFESMYHLQHRGQDSVGLFISDYKNYKLIKKEGLINNINWDQLEGFLGIGHIRYSTNNKTQFSKLEQAQPILKKLKYKLHKFIVMVHNGHVKLSNKIITYCKKNNIQYNNRNTDSDLFLDIFINMLYNKSLSINVKLEFLCISTIITDICDLMEGAYNIILYIHNFGLISFKDNYGIRPLVYGINNNNILISSESVSLSALNYKDIREVYPNDILFYNETQETFIISKKKDVEYNIKPCIFEWIYLARAESIIYNVPVYEVRLKMGTYLADHIRKELKNSNIDINEFDYVVPVPDTSRPYALSIANFLNIPYIEGIIKNRYIFRTFIMNSQKKRKKNLKRKLNVIPKLINNKNIILVDDSIVRGNTIRHILDLLKNTNVGKVVVVSCAPEIKSANFFGIDIPDRNELISFIKTPAEISKEFNVEKVIFQTKENLLKSIQFFNSNITQLEQSIFE